MGVFNLFKKPPEDPERTIRVEFVNAADNAVVAVSDVPLRQLPESFAIETTLDIKDEKWSVQSAEPAEKAAFAKSGKLRLVLSRLTFANPADILFSLPTISDDIGNVIGNALPNDRSLYIHEDDWRQIEFIADAFSQEIDQEIADIQKIWNSQQNGPGFKKVHVRKRIPEPLENGSLKLADLSETVPPQKRFQAVGFLRKPGSIAQSFAWSVCDDFFLWGVTDAEGGVLRLCLLGFPPADRVTEISAALGALAEQHHLHCVDWCRMTRASAMVEFQNYFSLHR